VSAVVASPLLLNEEEDIVNPVLTAPAVEVKNESVKL